MKIGVILASRNSSRFNDMKNEEIILSENLKQYIKFDNKYLIEHSIERFISLKNQSIIDDFFITIRREDEDFFKQNIAIKYNNKINICFGRETRAMSVLNSVNFASTNFKEIDHIIIHDAARPFTNDELFINLIKKLEETKSDCCFPALKINDAIRLIKNNIFKTIDRDGLHIVQTPQIFDFHKLKLCFELEKKYHLNKFELILDYYDEITLLEKYGGVISYIDGLKENIKITFKDDLDQKY